MTTSYDVTIFISNEKEYSPRRPFLFIDSPLPSFRNGPTHQLGPISPEDARELAALLIEQADQAEREVAQ